MTFDLDLNEFVIPSTVSSFQIEKEDERGIHVTLRAPHPAVMPAFDEGKLRQVGYKIVESLGNIFTHRTTVIIAKLSEGE